MRPAAPGDAAAIAAIYNRGIRSRMAAFETTEGTEEEIASWFAAPYPFLVAEHGESATSRLVVGFMRPATGPEHATPELPSSRCTPPRTSGPPGRRPIDGHFLPACAAAGFWKILSRTFVENAASRARSARYGFREVGVYEKHARLDGVGRDVVIVERILVAGAGLDPGDLP
jgi:L-amino acid N-acyltransferase YncA